MNQCSSAATLIHCTCIKSSNFAGNDELVAAEDSIDVGNVPWIFYDCLSLGRGSAYSSVNGDNYLNNGPILFI